MNDIFEGDVSRLAGNITLYLPGWATDHRIFESSPRLEGEETTLYMRHADPNDIPKLTAMIAKSSATWHLVGFSLGGFMAYDVARHVPHKVASLTLIGIREQYPAAICRAMQRQLNQDKKQLLEDFWQNAFGTRDMPMCAEDDYDIALLSRGLAYLAQYAWDASPFSFPVRCLHGETDAIAPLSEAQCLAKRHGWEFRVILGMGHGMPGNIQRAKAL